MSEHYFLTIRHVDALLIFVIMLKKRKVMKILSKRPLWNALNNPLTSMSLAIYSAAMLLLSSQWYVRISSILFIPFILEGIVRYVYEQPKIPTNITAGIIHIFLALIVAVSLAQELLQLNDPLILQIIASMISLAAILVLFGTGIIQLRGINRNKQ